MSWRFVGVIVTVVGVGGMVGCGGNPLAPSAPPTTLTLHQGASLSVTKFVAFGDSITAGENGQSEIAPTTKQVVPAQSWPTYLQADLLQSHPDLATQLQVVNEGVSGEGTAAALSRLPALLTTLHPDVVIIMEGTNDIDSGLASSIAPAVANLQQLAQDATQQHVVPILLTIPPQVAGERRAYAPALVAPFNTALLAMAHSMAIPVVDTGAPLAANISTLMGPDGLHPDALGYQQMATLITTYINSRWGTTPTTH